MASLYNILYNINMDLGTQNLNNLISKDEKLSKAAAESIINNSDFDSWVKLCEKSEFLFDFLKDKIIKNLANAVTSKNLHVTFQFIKVYNADFEDFITKVWLKFANEDLTDKILEFLETGTNEEQTYAAGYFYYINDSLALEALKEKVFSNFEPLAQNCARALSKFDDKELYNSAIDIIKSDIDDFEKYKYVDFLVSYGKKEAFNELYAYLENSYAKGFIASSILYLKSFHEIIQEGQLNKALRIFDIILSSYPEEISLDTVLDFEIFDFLRFLMQKIEFNGSGTNFENLEESYIKRLILKAKYKFNLISREDIYTFDLTKSIKKEINDMSAFLNTTKTDLFNGLEKELQIKDKERILEAFDVILNFGKIEFSNNIKEIVMYTKYEDLISEGIKVLKAFNRLNLIQKDEILTKLKNENIKAIVLDAFG